MADTGKGGISSPAADSSDIDTAFSKGLLNALLQADTGLLIMSIDMQHIIRHCNELAMRMLAPSIGQVIGRSVVDIHEQLGVDNKRFFAGLKKAQAQGEYRFEQKIEAEDGTHHLESRIIPLTETNGETTGYLFVSSDLKALKQAERMQRLLGKAVDQSPVAVIITDTLGITQYVNERFTLNTGYTADDVIGKRAGYQRSGQTPTEVYDGLWQTISAGREWRGELLNRRKSGELYWDAVRIVPLANTAGKITHYLSIQEDISQRKKDEETIRLWATVFENSGEAVVITDRDNRIVSVNQAFTDITGYAPGEVIGQNPAKFSSGRHDPDFFKEMWRRLNSYGHWQGEIWDRRKSGEVYPKWLGISAVRDGNDCVTHYVAIFSDISERKEAQERIDIHLLGEEAVGAAPCILGVIHRRVGFFQQSIEIATIGGEHGDTDGYRDRKPVAGDFKWLLRHIEYLAGDMNNGFVIMEVGDDDYEFVTAQSADSVGFAHRCLQAGGDFHEQGVADGMAE